MKTMARFLQVVRDLALLLARVGLGGILIAHGWRRWQQLGIDSQVAYLRQYATPFPQYAAWGATVLELVGGVLLVVGLLTPLVAAAVVVEQVLIVAWTSWYKGLWLTKVQGAAATWAGGWEYNVMIGVLALLFVVFGAGRISVDRLFRRRRRTDPEQNGDAAEGGDGTEPTRRLPTTRSSEMSYS
jgi:putative oxidoreductase